MSLWYPAHHLEVGIVRAGVLLGLANDTHVARPDARVEIAALFRMQVDVTRMEVKAKNLQIVSQLQTV